MMCFIYLKKIILFLFLLLFSRILYAQETLVFALDLIRHGDRTPLLVIPKDRYTWPEGMGQLTAIGMRQELQRGIEFRKKYIGQYHLLPVHFQNDAIYVFSTNFDRTLMSAEAVLLGLYPLGAGPLLPGSNKSALPGAYLPVPIHTKPADANDLFISDFDSAKYNQLLTQYVASRPDWIQKTKELQNKFPAWNKATGLNFTTLHQFGILADALNIYQIHHIPFPAGLSAADVKEIIAAGRWAFVTEYQTKEIAYIIGPRLVAKIADYLQKASQQKTPLKYVLFSAHDSTIMSVMTTLQAPLSAQPPYASDVNFALFKTDAGDYIVKVNYNGKPVAIPGCGVTSCTLTKFMQLAEHFCVNPRDCG